jgi:hypothetical protein
MQSPPHHQTTHVRTLPVAFQPSLAEAGSSERMQTSATNSSDVRSSRPTDWRACLQEALKRGEECKDSPYVQLATIRPDGRPANRTVVFRGFLGESDRLTFVTDVTSNKVRACPGECLLPVWERTPDSRQVRQLAACSFGEVCWWLPITREQFRLSGRVTVVDHACQDIALQAARTLAWQQLSEGGRAQFGWPYHASPAFADERDAPHRQLLSDEAVAFPFCLLVLTCDEVDYLPLSTHRRWVFRWVGERWDVEELCA